MASKETSHKALWLCVLGVICAALFFGYKTDACGMGPGCHESIKKATPENTPHCDVGATIQILNDGWVACRCPNK